MEQAQPSRLSSSDRRPTAAAFGRWLHDRMTERDYDLSARGGGQARLAAETNLGRTTISRLLNGGANNPDPESLRRIADALGLPFPDVLVRAGILTVDELRAYQDAPPPSDRPPLTQEEAAADLGIDDPDARDVFEAGVQAARNLQAKRRARRAS